MTVSYHALIEGKIFFGAAKDVKDMFEQERIEVVVDLREEAEACAYPHPMLTWVKIPLGDDTPEPQPELFKKAIDQVVEAYRAGKKVGFHCGGGRGRTGTVAVGTLMQLGLADSLEASEAKAKDIRPIIAVKPEQWEALRTIYK